MLWFQRANPASPGGEAPFMITYGQGNGKTGWLTRAAWSEDDIKVGGAWSNGGQGKNPTNLTVGGDIRSATGDDDDEVSVSTYIARRALKKKSHTVWDARTEIVPDVSNTLTGSLRVGPRWKDKRVRAALSIGPGLEVVNTDGVNATRLDMPASNIAAEYALRDWLLLRGSATAALRLSSTDVSNFEDTREFEMASGGLLGVGFKHEDTAVFDMSIAPPWLVNGPAMLSGSTNSMFLTVSGRVML
jgi:hypothetical protein